MLINNRTELSRDERNTAGKKTVNNQGTQIELLESKIRRKNLIVKRIPDDANEKSQETREKIGTVLQTIGAPTDTARDVDEVTRIEKYNNTRTPPIIVKLTTGRNQEIMELTRS
ncbi:hypothetical protein ILUMI_09912 [Ignelater luminosus]|uniref:Uncharacterized protein n=1 Tax=Ignelater luminosus TaxID=2038154 RepID=A0A8K0D4X6_IGNLU|nr:hypothetical protein ILUMI_09912 [Ignelater luminosus]